MEPLFVHAQNKTQRMKIFKKNSGWLLVLLAVLSASSIWAQSKTTSQGMDEMWGDKKVTSDALKSGKAKLFDEGNFGMFIHWGLFSNLGGKWNGKTYYGISEWIKHHIMANIPVDEYVEIAKEFNPENFNARKIAQLAKDAGMKYIIITSKHHEGFAMFDSKADLFNIVKATPFARDPMKELSAACHDLGLGFGFYYSHNQDWVAPGATGGPKTDANGNTATFENYFYTKVVPQVKEICTNYGKIDFIWFDTPGNMKKELVVELADVVEKLQPNAMLCSRIGHGMGDYASLGDMEVPAANIKGLWETCDTNNDSWAYAWYDKNFKSPKEILHRLVSTVGRGGTYLFNVGPDANGDIPEIGAAFLKETGNWIKKYPQVVYGAGSSPWGHALPWGDVTTKGNALFLSVFEWPRDGKLYLPGFNQKIVSATILGDGKKTPLSFVKKNGWTIFDVPYKAPDPLVSVIELKLDAKAENITVNKNLGVYPNTEATLLADFAKVTGADLASIRWVEKVGEWKHVKQISKWSKDGKAVWDVEVYQPGYYYMDAQYKGKGRLVWKAETDEGNIVQNQQGATEKYQYYPLGIVEFKKPGRHTVSVSLVEGDSATSSLQSITIRPINQ